MDKAKCSCLWGMYTVLITLRSSRPGISVWTAREECCLLVMISVFPVGLCLHCGVNEVRWEKFLYTGVNYHMTCGNVMENVISKAPYIPMSLPQAGNPPPRTSCLFHTSQGT